jgi:bifunctional non-homologous end joining protein LigD
MSLDAYRKKRRIGETPEPFGDQAIAQTGAPSASPHIKRALAFVVHLHSATRPHFDLRIEVDGVLASFAVPKGPSLDPSTKHLAIRTEDHPMEYLDFEDVIPKGNYGAGPMIVWDRGRIEPLGALSLAQQLEAGKVDFLLFGMKLLGRFALVRLKGEEKTYLLLKKVDRFSIPGDDIATRLPASVLSGLKVGDLEHKAALALTLATQFKALEHASTEHAMRTYLATGPAALLPRSSATCVGGFLWEPYFSGLPVRVVRAGGSVSLLRDGGAEVTAQYPELVCALLASLADGFVCDGMIVCSDAEGRPSITALAQRVAAMSSCDSDSDDAPIRTPAQWIAQDVLVAFGVSVVLAPAQTRRALLASLFAENGMLRAPLPFVSETGPPAALEAFIQMHGLEGLIATECASGKRFFVSEGGDPVKAMIPNATQSIETRADYKQRAYLVRTSNRQKVFWPKPQLTKGDLIDYYASIAHLLLPYLRDRPVILTRYPDGIGNKSFFQWNVPHGKPDFLETYAIEGASAKRVFLLQDVASLIYVANLGCIPLHMLPYRKGQASACDFLTLDFDVKLSGLRRAIPIVRTLKRVLEQAGLPGFLKTSGQTGVHVLVPLRDRDGAGASDRIARDLAQLLGHLVAREHRQDATVERVISRRGDKVFIDTGQTGLSRAIAAPFAARATETATVSMPLAWDALEEDLDPARYTLTSAATHIPPAGDPMAPLLTERVDLPRALTLLATGFG